MNPLDLLYGAPAVLAAATVIGVTKLITAILDATMGVEKRKANHVLSKVVLPATVVALGAVYGMLVPYRPESLVTFAESSDHGAWVYLAFAAWGGAVGQFSSYIYDRAMDVVRKK